MGHRLGGGSGDFGVTHQAGGFHPLQHAIARRAGILRIAVGAAALRQLRQRDEESCLRGGQALRLLAKIGQRSGAHALEIAAIGRQREIAVEDLLLGEASLDLQGAEQLAQLGAEVPAFARLDQAGKLHRQCRAARHDAAVARKLARRAQQGDRVDAAVVPEALVFIGDQHVDQPRVDIGGGGRQTPAAIDRGKSAQQPAIAVGDFD